MKKHNILLIGCGQLGSRHLQAIAALPEIDQIEILDSNPKALEMGQTRLKESTDLNRGIKFRWLKNLEDASPAGDLCLIATQSRGRSDLVKQAFEKLGYRKYFIEKIVTQSVGEYQELIRFSLDHDLKIWVNCKTRAYGVHKYIKAKLDPADPIMLCDVGGNHGLANNGVHSADLFVFYDGSKKIERVGSRIDPELVPSKRGADILDLSGVLWGHTEKGSDFILSFSSRHNSPDHVTIESRTCRFIVDHITKFACESYAEENWVWKPIALNENWNVSFMSKAFVSDILSKNSCELPTLEDCYPAHEYILSELLPYFNQRLNVQQTFCPVT